MSEKKVQNNKTEKAKKDLKNGAGLGQLTVTLCGICAVCALALAVVNMVTAPIIKANAEAKKTQAITANVMPGYTGVLSQVNYVGGDTTIRSVLKGDDNSFVVEVAPKGTYSGNLTLMVGIDPNRAITGVYPVSSGETPGKGSLALEADYLKTQYVGKSGPLTLGVEVDGVSGATITSTAVCNAVNSAFEAIDNTNDGPFDPSLVPDEPDPTDDIEVLSLVESGDGYAVTVDCSTLGFPGATLVLRVNIDTNKTVSGIEVVESTQTEGIGSNALTEEHLGKYVGQSGSVEVDGVSNATYTSNAVNTGVNAALKAVDAPAGTYPSAPVEGETGNDKPEAATGANVLSTEQEGDGYVVTVDCGADSFSKTLVLRVKLDANKAVSGIEVVESGETDGVGSNALTEEHLGKYVGQSGSVEVDGISNATYTSNAVNAGVNAALAAVSVGSEIEDNGVAVEQSGDGYVVTVDCGPNSFSKTLKIQVSIGADKKVTGVSILETGETAGFGALASEPDFIDQFVGVSGTVDLTTKGGEIESISGASTTSNAICVGVTAALKAVESLG